MITGLKYERGYLEWNVAYIFPEKRQTTLRFNLNSPHFREERKYWSFYVGDISHEEIHCIIYDILKDVVGKREAKKIKNQYDDIQGYWISKVRGMPYAKRLSYNGFLTEKALSSIPRKYLYMNKKKGKA